jgi:hypothetical protein
LKKIKVQVLGLKKVLPFLSDSVKEDDRCHALFKVGDVQKDV